MDKHAKQKIVSLHRMVRYVLGRRPDEFGLSLRENGTVELKEFLQALHEEPDWRYVRRAHLLDIFLVDPEPGFTVDETIIRVTDPEISPVPVVYPEDVPPRVVYHAARRRAYPSILENGLSTAGARPVVLSTMKEMALRIGNRRDPSPILLEVHTDKARDRGVVFRRVHELLYLTDAVPPDCLTGPPPPKEQEKPESKKPKPEPMPVPAGSFYLDPSMMGLGGGVGKEEKHARREKDRRSKTDRNAARKLKRQK